MQKKVVASALGYEVHEGVVHYNSDAPDGLQFVEAFVSGNVYFAIDGIDWGGVRPPAEDASFEDLTPEQRAIVADTLGYAIYEQQVFYNADGGEGRQVLVTLVQGTDYQNTTLDWGDLDAPADDAAFEQLDLAQQERVLEQTGYRRFDGVVYHDAEAVKPADSFVLTFEQGTSYLNSTIIWSDVDIPEKGTAFEDMTAAQQYRILEQSGYTHYEGTVYYKAGAGDNELMTSFTEGLDYQNSEIVTPAAETNRWIIEDGEHRYMVYALDDDGDGVIDKIQVQDPHEPVGPARLWFSVDRYCYHFKGRRWVSPFQVLMMLSSEVT